MNEQWHILMTTSPTATWFQSEEAYLCFESCRQWLDPFLVQVHRGDRLVGSLLGYVTKEHFYLKQFFTARAVIYGGPLLAKDITGDELLQLLTRTKRESEKRKTIYTEIRNFRDFSRWRQIFEQVGFIYAPHYDIHIDTSVKSKMVARIHGSKLRVVHKALADGQSLVEATTEGQVREWYQSLRHLYKTKVHRPLWSCDFFLHLWREGYAKLLITIKKTDNSSGKKQEIGGIFCVKDDTTLYEWYICGSSLVTYGALEYAADNGSQCFDLMGAGEPGVPYGVRDFKMQFGGELKEFGRYHLISKPLLYRLGKTFISLTSNH